RDSHEQLNKIRSGILTLAEDCEERKWGLRPVWFPRTCSGAMNSLREGPESGRGRFAERESAARRDGDGELVCCGDYGRRGERRADRPTRSAGWRAQPLEKRLWSCVRNRKRWCLRQGGTPAWSMAKR